MTARTGSVGASFRYATQGLWYLLRTQRNAQIQASCAILALALAALLRISRLEWLVLILTIALVLALEGVNTALEAVVDLVTGDYHPLAKVAKDVAAGAVWTMALASLPIGALIFLPRLLALLAGQR